MTKTKRLVVFLATVCSCAVAFGIAGCSHNHTYSDDWTYDATYHWHAATCEHADEVSSKAEHTYGDGVETTAATCTADGVMTYTCTVCGYEETETIEASGHSYVSEVTKEATCTEKGVTTYTCSVCGDTYTEEIAAKGHSYVSEVTKEATCTEKGVTTYTCSVCGDTYTEEIAANGHSYGEWIAEVPATHTTDGTLGHYTCSVCGKYFDADYKEITNLTITASEDAHTYGTWIAEVAATCTETGTKGHYQCSECKKYFDASYNEITDLTIAATGHSYVSEVTKEATCTEEGVTTYTCSVCGDAYTEEIAATSHDYATAWSTDESEHWHVCLNCEEKTDVASHSFGDWTYRETNNNDDTEETAYVRSCSVCGYEQQVSNTLDMKGVGNTGSVSATFIAGGDAATGGTAYIKSPGQYSLTFTYTEDAEITVSYSYSSAGETINEATALSSGGIIYMNLDDTRAGISFSITSSATTLFTGTVTFTYVGEVQETVYELNRGTQMVTAAFEGVRYDFTASDSGTYILSSDDSNATILKALNNNSGDGAETVTLPYEFTLNKNDTITFYMSYADIGNPVTSYSVTIELKNNATGGGTGTSDDPIIITELGTITGETTTGQTEIYYSYTATANGTLTITGLSNYTDATVYVAYNNFNYQIYYDANGTNNNVKSLDIPMNKGDTITFYVDYYDGTGTVGFAISFEEKN